jgi:2,3-bisphosphoglycerate-dependent phosphoglycerate mutase
VIRCCLDSPFSFIPAPAVTKTEIILVRHGETVWNRERRHQGTWDSPLTARGIAQSKALAARVALQELEALYSSDLGRAIATARHIAAASGLELRRDPRLRERHHGIFQGRTVPEIEEGFTDDYELYKTGPADYAIPGGESIQSHFDRVWPCIEEIAGLHRGGRVAVVTHGGVLGLLVRHILGLPLNAPRHFKLYNGAYNSLIESAGRWSIGTLGEITHLGCSKGLRDPADAPAGAQGEGALRPNRPAGPMEV